ncbi:MAG: 4Fe-4S binding protein [Lachnospiraceae bacterium]|nr:4Fe-4S binding protein [Candidatus Equihabitans merdae]
MAIMNFGKTMLKNLFLKPVTVNYPAEPAVYPEGSRGHVEIDVDKCISCTICAMNCPSDALKVDRQAGTWTINRFDCIACGYCVEKCPKKCLKMVPGYQEPMGEKTEETFRRPEESMAKAAKPAKPTVTAAPSTGIVSTHNHVSIDVKKCLGCGKCMRNCPNDALAVDRKAKTWSINRSKCITCGLCIDNCPTKCMTMDPNDPDSNGIETYEIELAPIKKKD